MGNTLKKNTSLGIESVIAYGIAIAFSALAIFFTMSASSQDQAFISSELGIATFSPNGPAGGMLVPASGCSGYGGEANNNTIKHCHSSPPPPPPLILGCSDPIANNYNPSVDFDDGSCTYPPPVGNWSIGNWGSCTGSCGTNGLQYRTVFCSSSTGCTGMPPFFSRGCMNLACPAGSPSPSPSPGPLPDYPEVTISARILPGSTSYTSPQIFISPSDTLELTWDSPNATNCSNNFGGGNATSDSHTFNFTPSLNPGGSRVFQVTCTNSIGFRSDSITARVPELMVDTFDISPSVVRTGESALMQWRIQLSDPLTATGNTNPYSYTCQINGAIPSAPYIFDAAVANGEGSVPTRDLTNRSVGVLQCGTFLRDSATVDVVPSFEEI